MVKNHQKRILIADEIIFIFPIWWESMPAMMKGFFDKVISKGIVYEQGKGKIFKNNFKYLKKVKMVTVMSTPNWIYKYIFGSPITKIVFRATFRKMGFNKLKWYNFSKIEKMNLNKRKRILESYGRKIAK